MRELRFIAVEGVIGAGKTTLAKVLGERLHAGLLLEEFDDNPFLAKFYANPNHYAFQTQIYFLLARYRQQRTVTQTDLFHSRLVADYLFAKDRIFAEINLNDDEFALYDKIYSLIEKEIPRPDLVIYLQGAADFLYKRIKQRNRSFERDINYEYVEALSNAYNTFFFHYNTSPLLIVNIRGFDFLGDSRDADLVFNEIQNLKGARKIISKE